MSIGRQILLDGAAAACSFGPQAFIPAIAGSYATRKVISLFNFNSMVRPGISTAEKITNIALAALSIGTSVMFGLSIASILGFSFSLNQATGVYIVSEAFSRIIEYLQPQNRPGVFLP